jgi:hypothetical protein
LERRGLLLLLIGSGIESRLGMVSNACYMYMHIYMHMYMHVYTHTHTRTHTHIKMRKDTWLLASEAV